MQDCSKQKNKANKRIKEQTGSERIKEQTARRTSSGPREARASQDPLSQHMIVQFVHVTHLHRLTPLNDPC